MFEVKIQAAKVHKKAESAKLSAEKRVSCLPNALDLTEEKHQKHAYTQRNRSFFGTFR
jgi:hypothetical protein